MKAFLDKVLKKPEGPLLFDRKDLVRLIIPLALEQVLSATVGIADTMMVSAAGEAAISGISLVNQIAVILIVLFSSMASGGTVVTAQYLGKRDYENARDAARHLVWLCLTVALTMSVFALAANRFLLRTIYGSVERDVMDAAILYFTITAFSFPFMALYNASASLFRAMGNTKISLLVSIAMNAVNIAGNAVLIYGYGMGVAGAALATLASRVVATVIMMILLFKEKWPANLRGLLRHRIRRFMVRQVMRIGVPQGLENTMFQVGKLLTASLISGFGTASIAANACAANVEQMCFLPGNAIGLAMVTVIGQCVGADDFRQVKYYAKKMMLMAFVFMGIVNVAVFAFAGPIIGMYNLSDEGTWKALILLRYYCACCVLMWPLAFTTPSILRAAGDAKFTMLVSSITMWVCRVVLAYVIAPPMEARWGLGVWGVWIAMTLDWIFRAACYLLRLRGDRWTKKSLVK